MGAFKVELGADAAGFLKATGDIEKALTEVAGDLDKMAADTEANATQAANALESKFSKALEEVGTEARQTSRRIGDDVKDGTRRATQGVDDFKVEGKQSIRETAASFGEVTDALDLVQEVAANAFSGFGPAGMAAGAIAAIGIGLVKTMLDDTAEKANAAREATAELAGELIDVKGNPAAIDWAEKLKETLLEVVNTKEWYEFWEADNGPSTRLQEWSAKAREYGVDMHDVTKMVMGDQEAEARVLDVLKGKQAELLRLQAEANAGGAGVSQTYLTQADAVASFTRQLTDQSGQLRSATDLAKLFAESTDATAQAQKDATDAAATFSQNLTEHLSVADEGLDRFVRDGKLNLKAWAKELRERAAETATVEDFTVDVAPKLSPAALQAFEQLPTETQAQIAKAYGDGKGKKAKRVIQNLEAEAKVTKVTVDTSGAKVAPVEVPTTVVSAGAIKGTQDAADAAQDVANRDSNRIEFNTRIDRDELQRQVNRAAAAITPPTITVKTRVQKEVP